MEVNTKNSIVAALATATVADPSFVTRAVRHYLQQPISVGLNRISKQELAEAVSLLGLTARVAADEREKNKILVSVQRAKSRSQRQQDAVVDAVASLSGDGLLSRMSQPISVPGQGLAEVAPDETNVAMLVEVLTARLSTELEADEMAVINTETVISKLVRDLFEMAGVQVPSVAELEQTVGWLVPEVVVHVVEFERGISKFDVTSLKMPMQQQQTTLRLLSTNVPKRSFFSLFKHPCLSLGEEFLPQAIVSLLSARAPFLWKKHGGPDKLSASMKITPSSELLLGNKSEFLELDQLNKFYDKDMWGLVYLRELANLCANSKSLDQFWRFRHAMFQTCVLYAISRGIRTKSTNLSAFYMQLQYPQWPPTAKFSQHLLTHNATQAVFANMGVYVTRKTNRVGWMLFELELANVFPMRMMLDVTEALRSQSVGTLDTEQTRNLMQIDCGMPLEALRNLFKNVAERINSELVSHVQQTMAPHLHSLLLAQ